MRCLPSLFSRSTVRSAKSFNRHSATVQPLNCRPAPHRMMRRPFGSLALFAATSAILAACLIGCDAGPNFDAGQRAEKARDYHVAYDAYCQAAVQNPDNGTVATAIRRVAPKAAAFWKTQGHRAVGEGRYPDAWRMFMRVLEIEPNHPSAALVLRQLEKEHGPEVAFVRQEYEKKGARSLVVDRSALRGTDGAAPPVAVASAGSSGTNPNTRVASAEQSPSIAVAEADETPMIMPGPSARVEAAGPPPPPAPRTTPQPYSTVSPPPPPQNPPYIEAPPQPQPPVARQPQPAAPPMVVPQTGQFLVVRTLSKEDRRYARKREFIDGVAIRLDSVDDRDVDLEMYTGGVKIGKIDDIGVNRSARFVGLSGQRYRLVVLEIRERTETVRIGILPG